MTLAVTVPAALHYAVFKTAPVTHGSIVLLGLVATVVGLTGSIWVL